MSNVMKTSSPQDTTWQQKIIAYDHHTHTHSRQKGEY